MGKGKLILWVLTSFMMQDNLNLCLFRQFLSPEQEFFNLALLERFLSRSPKQSIYFDASKHISFHFQTQWFFFLNPNSNHHLFEISISSSVIWRILFSFSVVFLVSFLLNLLSFSILNHISLFPFPFFLSRIHLL